ncbi:MAG: hypothetical protein ACRCUY_08955 [Thermoguttaceae bacterium]
MELDTNSRNWHDWDMIPHNRSVHGGFVSDSPCPPCLCVKNKPSMRCFAPPFRLLLNGWNFFLSLRHRVHGGFVSDSPCPPCLCAENKPSIRSRWSLLSGFYF